MRKSFTSDVAQYKHKVNITKIYMNKDRKSKSTLNAIKCISQKIISIIKQYLNGDNENTKALLEIKGKDSIINTLSKITTILCRVTIAEKHYIKSDAQIEENQNQGITDVDIEIMKDFIQNYNSAAQNNKK